MSLKATLSEPNTRSPILEPSTRPSQRGPQPSGPLQSRRAPAATWRRSAHSLALSARSRVWSSTCPPTCRPSGESRAGCQVASCQDLYNTSYSGRNKCRPRVAAAALHHRIRLPFDPWRNAAPQPCWSDARRHRRGLRLRCASPSHDGSKGCKHFYSLYNKTVFIR